MVHTVKAKKSLLPKHTFRKTCLTNRKVTMHGDVHKSKPIQCGSCADTEYVEMFRNKKKIVTNWRLEKDTKVDMEDGDQFENRETESQKNEFQCGKIIEEFNDITVSCAYTSIPRKSDTQCEECTKVEQCGDCLVKYCLEEHGIVVSCHFPSDFARI